jgi:hypothetical protein
VTVAAERLPDANGAAFVDLPAVIVWDLEKAATRRVASLLP